jgi:hypothetical protein
VALPVCLLQIKTLLVLVLPGELMNWHFALYLDFRCIQMALDLLEKFLEQPLLFFFTPCELQNLD